MARLEPGLQGKTRAFHRVLKLARTIADIASSERIASPHLAEAISTAGAGLGRQAG